MKRKAILASAMFGIAVLASCGSDGGAASTGTGTSVSGETVKVLAQTLSGNSNQVVICDLNPDNTINCGKNINPDANTTFRYEHEFSNGITILTDSNNKAYYFDPATGTLNKLTNGKDVAGNSLNTQLDLASYQNLYRFSNYAIYLTNGDDTVSHVIITKSGQYIQKTTTGNNIYTFFMGDNVVVVKEVGHTYRIDTNGNVVEIKDGNGNSIEFQNFLAKVGDNILAADSNNNIYLLRNDGKLLKLDTSNESDIDGQMVQVGSDFYVAIRTGSNLYYYKNDKKLLDNPIALSSGANRTYYAFDGIGNLYYYDGSNVNVMTTGLVASSNSQPVSNFGGLIGTSAGVIASDTANNQLYLLSTSGNTITSKTSTDTNLLNAVNTCINGKSQIATGYVKDEGTNKVMCVDNSGNFSGIIYNNGNYTGKKITAIQGFGRVIYINYGSNSAMVDDDSSTTNTEMCSLNSINSTCVRVPDGKFKRLNDDIIAKFEDGTFYLVDPVAGTSNPISLVRFMQTVEMYHTI
ncbi:MAG: hypothetical protein JHC33_06460 [Ignisphaera sp.]|nr:hypothetical protein [Ignisphaera sp.]